MKIVCVSDQHGSLPPTPPCDLLIVAGDLCPLVNHDPAFQARWLNTAYRYWLQTQPAKHIVGICGNHDLVYERARHLVPSLPWTYLEHGETMVEGLKIFGSPWTPRFCDWAFNADPPQLARLWSQIPDDTDVLITHGPPRGCGDMAPRAGNPPWELVGCRHLLERIMQLPKLRLHVYGHIHEGAGEYSIGNARLINAACRVVEVEL